MFLAASNSTRLQGYRKLSMTCSRTAEQINTVYWIDGEYIPGALAEINLFMRDWRKNDSREMDVRNLDILAATHVLLGSNKPFDLISGYRTEDTNRKMAERSSGVASNSLHVVGMAADVRLPDRSIQDIAKAAEICRAGGIGRYPASDFVHLDCGRYRKWSG